MDFLNFDFLVNCNRNKTEIIILSPNLSLKDAKDLPNVKMGNTDQEYFEKSKVLGVTIDENLTFPHHAREVPKNCWHAWHKVSNKTTKNDV